MELGETCKDGRIGVGTRLTWEKGVIVESGAA